MSNSIPAVTCSSLGLVVYEMACGQRAFAGQTLVDVQEAITASACRSGQSPQSVLPRSLDLVLAKALEKDRNPPLPIRRPQ